MLYIMLSANRVKVKAGTKFFPHRDRFTRTELRGLSDVHVLLTRDDEAKRSATNTLLEQRDELIAGIVVRKVIFQL